LMALRSVQCGVQLQKLTCGGFCLYLQTTFALRAGFVADISFTFSTQ